MPLLEIAPIIDSALVVAGICALRSYRPETFISKNGGQVLQQKYKPGAPGRERNRPEQRMAGERKESALLIVLDQRHYSLDLLPFFLLEDDFAGQSIEPGLQLGDGRALGLFSRAAQEDPVAERIGRIDDEDIVRLNQALMVFLGLAVSPKSVARS